MMQRGSSSLRLLAALLLFASAQGKRLAFNLHSDGAYCSSSTYDVQVNLVKFSCTTGEDVCRPGDEVVIEGHFEAKNFLPVDVTERVKACKFFGTLCTPVLGYTTDSLQDDWHLYSMYDNATYPGAGLYGFEKTFTWPDSTLTDYPWAGLNFNLVVDIHADDAGNDYTHMRCHAPFTTVDYDTFKENGKTGSGFSYSFGKWSIVGVVGLGAYLQRKRRLQAETPSIDLGDDEAGCTDFEMMGTSGDASVRV